ncbi:MAG: HD-GYP domain-containing protein [Methylotenera sp.]|uniref:HD-GYP domain-containing protein n=1 Tax=Methylotenera sp. TaxID=2051956 RepID=UPI0024897951|nr:HD-GYP domain-containing protein [Methylotenera sp.]MDI1309282.1 HD-GYP domain-containing protein [Methylotenera sp.]
MNHVEHLLKSLYIMASMVEARDPYTGGHLWRVSQFSRVLAENGGLPTSEIARIALGGFLHDLGKISVPDAILNKPDKLTDEEYNIIKTHPDVGSRLLSDHPLADLARPAVLSHHEMPNGRGYPHGLSGEQISLDASIVGVCDAFDAMTSTRPYRKGMPTDVALGIIQTNLGSQFHTEWGSSLVSLGESGRLDHIIGHSEFGIPLQQCPMCGPTLVINRHHQHGDHIYCRSCGGEAEVKREGARVYSTPTARKGVFKNLEPEIDNSLLDELVKTSSGHLGITA